MAAQKSKRGPASVPAQPTRTITLGVTIPGSREDCEVCCACADDVVDAAVSGDIDRAADLLKDLRAHVQRVHV